MTLIVLGLAFINILALLLLGINPAAMAALVFVLLGAIYLAVRGRDRLAGTMVSTAALLIFTTLMFQNKGLRDIAILALPLLVIAASLMHGVVGVLIFAALSLASLGALYLAETNGWVVNPFTPYNAPSDYLAAGIAVIFIAALQWAVLQRMKLTIAASQKALAERTEAENALRESEARYRQLVEEAPLPILLFDQKLNVIEVNPAFVEMTGYAPADVSGLPVTNLIEAADLAGQPFRFSELQSGMLISGERLLVAKDGAHIPVFYTTRKLADGRFQSVLQDITLRKKAEQAFRLRHNELEDRVRERTADLEASNRELESFSYAVSHDLRAPLRAISGFSELLFENYADRMDEEGANNLNRIRENIRQMGLLIDDLLAFSRLGRGALYPQPVYVRGLLEDIIVSFAAEASSRKVAWHIGTLPDCTADYAMLRQVFANLIENALKYSRIREETVIEMAGRVDSGDVVYWVGDNGVGFDMKYANKLFGIFNRLHHDDEVEGTGIGLAIVQRVVQRHGGRVWAEAEAGKGAKFYFSIPQSAPRDG